MNIRTIYYFTYSLLKKYNIKFYIIRSLFKFVIEMSTYFKEDPNEGISNNLLDKAHNYYQAINDKVQFFKKERWIVVAVLAIFYFLRLIITGGIEFYFIGFHFIRLFCINLLPRNSSTKCVYWIHFPFRRSRRGRRISFANKVNIKLIIGIQKSFDLSKEKLRNFNFGMLYFGHFS